MKGDDILAPRIKEQMIENGLDVPPLPTNLYDLGNGTGRAGINIPTNDPLTVTE